MSSEKKIAVVGSGLIGKSWAMIFASKGYKVVLYDIVSDQVSKALETIQFELQQFENDGLLRGDISAVEQANLISGSSNLKECIQDAYYVIENVPEDLDIKLKTWTEIDGYVNSDQTILASSTSCIVPSKISENLKHRERFIVAHPVNPPYHCPMVEIVPAPWTSEKTRSDTRAIIQSVGQVPVSMSRELPGFILNRMQYTLLNECWRLVASDVVSPADLDVVIKDGLGMRWAMLGPMETIHLNADGVKNYCEKYGNTIYNISAELGEIPTAWKMETQEDKDEVERMSEKMLELFPLDKLAERRLLRDKKLASLAKLKKELD